MKKKEERKEEKKIRTYTIKGKYHFTDEEKATISKDLANKQVDMSIVEDEKKSVMSTYKDRVDRFKLDINRLSRNIIDGYEFRDYECKIIKDFKRHIKRFVDIHTGNDVDEQPLDPSDYQEEMPI